MPLVWTHSCFRGEMGGPETLDSFSGFVRLAQIVRTFTFCGELLRINGVTRDSWIEPQECRRFYIYRDVWLLSFPTTALLPLRYPADLGAVPSVPRRNRQTGPLSMLWERPGSPKRPSVWMALRQPMLLRYSGQQEGRLNVGLELEINSLHILMQLKLRSRNHFMEYLIFSRKIKLICYFTV